MYGYEIGAVFRECVIYNPLGQMNLLMDIASATTLAAI